MIACHARRAGEGGTTGAVARVGVGAVARSGVVAMSGVVAGATAVAMSGVIAVAIAGEGALIGVDARGATATAIGSTSASDP